METLEEVFLDCLNGDVRCSFASCESCPGNATLNRHRLCAGISDFVDFLFTLKIRDINEE